MTHVLANEASRPEHHGERNRTGPTATDLFLRGKPSDVVERLSKLAPLERLGQPEDIVAAVSFLVGPKGA